MQNIRYCFIAALLLTAAVAAQQNKAPQPTPTPKAMPTPKVETFTQRMLRVFGITVMPSLLRGDEDDLHGDLWLADVSNGTVRRLTREGGYRSPVMLDDQRVWALKGETIVEIPVNGGAPVTRFTVPGIKKLAGVANESALQVIILRNDAQPIVELLAVADGKRTALSYATSDEPMLAYLSGWERSYDNGRLVLFTQSETKTGAADTVIEWRDVYLKTDGGEPVNLSHGDGVNCGQPALAPNRRQVVYVKATS